MSEKQSIRIPDKESWEVDLLGTKTVVINNTGVAIDFIVHINGTIHLKDTHQ
jgi:hypothetical protein